MRPSWQNFVVGLCTIVALAGMSALLLLFGELTFLFEHRYPVELRVNTAAGLRAGSQVMLEGVPVGEVDRIRLEAGAALPVVLTLKLERDQPVPANVKPCISAGLLGGGSRIDLRIPQAGASVQMIDPAQPPVLEARFTSLTEQLDGLLARINAGEGTLGRLMNDPALYEQAREAAERLALTLRDLQQLVRQVKEQGVELKF